MSKRTLIKIIVVAGVCGVFLFLGSLVFINYGMDSNINYEDTKGHEGEQDDHLSEASELRASRENDSRDEELAGSEVQEEGEHSKDEVVELQLFFADEAAVESGKAGKYGFVEPLRRTLPYDSGVLRLALRELIKGPGPDESGFTRTIAETVKILNLELTDGVAVINLSSNALYGGTGGSLEGLLFIQSVVLTATQFPTVESVQVLVLGHPWEDGHYLWNKPLTAKEILAVGSH